MRRLAFVSLAIGAAMSFASTAFATAIVVPPVAAAPEPATLSILGAAIAGLVIGGRFIRRK